MSGDKAALVELSRLCEWDWDDSLQEPGALAEILAEIHGALDFRIGWRAARD